MAKKINCILEGEYKGHGIFVSGGILCITEVGRYLDKSKITSYDVIDESSKDSAAYSLWKGALGAVLLGGVGVVAGIGGKKKSTKEYLISVEWVNGEKSLILLDDKYYKILVRNMF